MDVEGVVDVNEEGHATCTVAWPQRDDVHALQLVSDALILCKGSAGLHGLVVKQPSGCIHELCS